MNKKQSSLLTLTMIALLVGIINGIFDIAYNMQRTFEASAVNDYGESLKVKVVADSGRPPFLWYLAWRVGSNPITTVNIGITITPSGTNVGNLKVTYYIKGVSGSNSKKFLSATSLSATSGQQITNSTGNVAINDHLSQLGLSTTQDQTVNYKIYCKVEGTGLISGDTLVAEITETQFDSIFYDYGGTQSGTFGCTTTGGTSTSVSSSYNIYGSLFYNFPYAGATPLRIKAELYNDGGAGEGYGSWSAAVYGDYDEDYDPDTRIAYSGRPGHGSGWAVITFELTVDETMQQGKNYFLLLENVFKDSDDKMLQINNAGSFYRGSGTAWDVNGYDLTQSSSNSLRIWLEYEYTDWSLSWNWFNLPLSVVSLPIGRQFIAILFMILAFAIWAAAREKKRRKGGSRR